MQEPQTQKVGGKSMRAYQDLREFLSVLEQEQQLLRITDQVKFEPDLAAAACALARSRQSFLTTSPVAPMLRLR
jgi:3-polyprenyl-4-hydroxybenzoate decarboxylase